VSVKESFAALQERQFRLLFTGQIVSLLGDAITGVALAFAVLDVTHSASDLGFVFAAKTVPLVGFLLAGGVFADRLPRRAVMLTADVVRMCSQGAVAVLLLTHSAHLWELIVTQAVAGTATAFFNPASTGLTPLTVSPERLQQANALRGMSMAFAGVTGYALSGILTASVGPGYALAIDAASFGFSAVFLAQLRLPPHVTLPPQSFLADLHDGWREFIARTWVWVIVVAAAIGNMMTSFFPILGAVLFKRELGGAVPWAIVLVLLSLGQIAGGVVALRMKLRRPMYSSTWLLFFNALVIALLAVKAPTPVLAAGGFLSGAANMIFNSFWETALQQHIPPAALSRVSAYDWFGSLAMQPIGLMIAGPLAAGIGIGRTLWLAAAVICITNTLTLVTPSVRNLRGLYEPQLEQLA
jgi:predicted MFS family arabinose efflux permease